jgi:hypothetical protein
VRPGTEKSCSAGMLRLFTAGKTDQGGATRAWRHTQYQHLGSVCNLFVAPVSGDTRWPRDPSPTIGTQSPAAFEVGNQRQSDARDRYRSGQRFSRRPAGSTCTKSWSKAPAPRPTILHGSLRACARSCAREQRFEMTQNLRSQRRAGLRNDFQRNLRDLVLPQFRTVVVAQNVQNEFNAGRNAELLVHTKQIILYCMPA